MGLIDEATKEMVKFPGYIGHSKMTGRDVKRIIWHLYGFPMRDQRLYWRDTGMEFSNKEYLDAGQSRIPGRRTEIVLRRKIKGKFKSGPLGVELIEYIE
jgi:hypothetical protein